MPKSKYRYFLHPGQNKSDRDRREETETDCSQSQQKTYHTDICSAYKTKSGQESSYV